jgi:membrane protein
MFAGLPRSLENTMSSVAKEKGMDRETRSKRGLHILGLHWRQWAHCIGDRWSKDRVSDQAAVLAYYFFFAVFPLLLCLTALLGMFVAPGTIVHRAIIQYLGAIVPADTSDFIEKTLQDIAKGSSAGKLSLGLAVALWSASSGMSAIIHALNQAYEVQTERPWWRQKLVALGLTIVVTALMVAALLMVVSGGNVANTLASHFGWQKQFVMLWNVVQWPLLLMFVLGAFGLIYYYGPHVPGEKLRRLLPGTLTGVGIWLAISFAFRFYAVHFGNYNKTYGSIGAVIVLLLWFYLSSLAILIGGEINSVLEHNHDDRKGTR